MLPFFLYLVLIFCSSVISGFIGFGGGMITLSFGSFFWELRELQFLATIMGFPLLGFKMYLFWKHIQWKQALTVGFTSIPFMWIGAGLSPKVPGDFIRLLFGLVVISYVGYAFVKARRTKNNTDEPLVLRQPAWYTTLSFGVVWGLVSGMVGVAGAILVMYLDRIGLQKEKMIGTIAAAAIWGAIVKTIRYTLDGDLIAFIPFQPLWMAFLGVVMFGMLGIYTGKQVLRYISPGFSAKIVRVALLVIGVRMVVGSLLVL